MKTKGDVKMRKTKRITNQAKVSLTRAELLIVEGKEAELEDIRTMLISDGGDGRMNSLVSTSLLKKEEKETQDMIFEKKRDIVLAKLGVPNKRGELVIPHHEPTSDNREEYFYVRVSDSTKSEGRRKIKARTEEAVVEKAFEYLRSQFYEENRKKKSEATFEEFFEEGLRAKRLDNVSDETLRKYRADYNRFIKIDGCKLNKPVKSITTEDVKEHTINLLKEKKLNRKAYMSYKGVLNLAFNAAKKDGVILTLPTDDMKNSNYVDLYSNDTPRVRADGSSRPSGTDGKIFTKEEVEAIVAEARNSIDKEKYSYYSYAVIISAMTGMRTAELMALKWSDVYFESGLIRVGSQQLVTRKNGKRVYEDKPWTKDTKHKNDGMPKQRWIPLYEELEEVLNELKERQEELGIESKYVICRENGDWARTKGYEEHLESLCIRLGYEITNNHALRMSFNTNVLDKELKLHVQERAKIMGHSKETNLNYYTFEDKDYLNEIRNALSRENRAKREIVPKSTQEKMNGRRLETA